MKGTYRFFQLELRAAGIAILKVNRPETKNSMDEESWSELLAFFRSAQEDDRIKVVILASEVPGVFIAGADIKEFRSKPSTEMLFCTSNDVIRAMDRLRKPIIAAVQGGAYGGGFEMALASDIRIVADNAVFSLPETTLGVIPGLGGTQRLSKMIGLGRAKEIIMAGRVIRGEECVSIGLAMKCVPQETLLEEAVKIAVKMLQRGPMALAIAKNAINFSYGMDMEAGIFVENLGFCAMLESKEMMEGTGAFLEKRKPDFHEREGIWGK